MHATDLTHMFISSVNLTNWYYYFYYYYYVWACRRLRAQLLEGKNNLKFHFVHQSHQRDHH